MVSRRVFILSLEWARELCSPGRRKRTRRAGQHATMIPMAHSRAVQTATDAVSAETARATIRATDMIIAMPPRLKMEIRPHNCRREMWRLRRRRKGRRKTDVREKGEGVLMISEMMFVATEVKKTGRLAEEIH
jgi:hypothetical protein